MNTTAPKKNYAINEKYFLMILIIVASVMLFMAFSSAYIVHKSDATNNNMWYQYTLPFQFWISTIVIVVSSIFMQLSYRAAKQDDIQRIPALLSITFALGLVFCISQFLAASELISKGLYFSNKEPGEISVSFLYVIAGAHFLHIIGGLVLLFIGILKASKLKIHKKNLVFINICKTYWHFLGILWVYLILFIYFA